MTNGGGRCTYVGHVISWHTRLRIRQRRARVRTRSLSLIVVYPETNICTHGNQSYEVATKSPIIRDGFNLL